MEAYHKIETPLMTAYQTGALPLTASLLQALIAEAGRVEQEVWEVLKARALADERA